MFPGLAILFWWAVALAALVAAVVLLAMALRRRSTRHALAGLGTLLGVMVAGAFMRTGMDQWNPRVDAGAVVGTWEARGSRLELRPDGTFRIDASGLAARRTGLTRASGSWTLDDWDLDLHPAGGATHDLRVVVARGTYRIIEQPEDLDGWTAWPGFHRTPPAPAPECRACE